MLHTFAQRKIMKPKGLIAILCCALAFAACKKEKNENNSPTGQTLKAGVWQISAFAITRFADRDTFIETYSHWDTCEQDDYLVFYNNGTGELNENDNICPEDNISETFEWNLLENDSKLNLIYADGRPRLFTLQQVSDTLVKMQADDVVAGKPAVVVATYTNIK